MIQEGKQTMTLKGLVTRREQVEGKWAAQSEEHLGERKYCQQHEAGSKRAAGEMHWTEREHHMSEHWLGEKAQHIYGKSNNTAQMGG